ncbi:MAG: hypothetical protein KCHDKBKB_01190 [Elusimicrobia bacterium]|nr:hypothetical protein [Elusimicrobiota bacterium]
MLFVNSSWFALHFAEGHIPFGLIQLLPLAFYSSLRFRNKKMLFLFFLLMAFFLINGGNYAFFYALILVGCAVFIRPKNLIRPLNISPVQIALLLGMFLGLSATKIIPSILFLRGRTPYIKSVSLPLDVLSHIFLNPFGHLLSRFPTKGDHWGYHEYGLYLGVVVVLLLAINLFRREFLIKNYPFLLLATLFLWIGAGWFYPLNPYWIIEQLPYVKNFRVPSRFFILFYLIVIILVCRILSEWKNPISWKVVGLWLLAESLFVHNYPFWKGIKDLGRPNDSNQLISNKSIYETVHKANLPRHYYLEKNSISPRLPACAPSWVIPSNNPAYQGEVYFVYGKGDVKLVSFIPGEIEVEFESNAPAIIQFNTNQLLGWKIKEGNAKIIPNNFQLLTIETFQSSGKLRIVYQPFYFKVVLGLYLIGWWMLILNVKALRVRVPYRHVES